MEFGHAACFYGPRKPFVLKEFPVPEPETGAIVIKTALANICGSDLHQWRGTFDLAAFGRPLPQILGHELTGIIHDLGKGVATDSAGTPVEIGDRVVFRYFYPCQHCRACASGVTRACVQPRTYLNKSCEEPPHFTGGYADYYYLQPGVIFYRVPDTLSDPMVSGANCALSQVICGLEEARLTLGDTIVIQGAGGLGIYAIAVAREMGAASILVIEGIPERIELARAFGADHVLDLQELARSEDRIRRVLDITDGWGARVVADFVGQASAGSEGIQMLARSGRYLEIGSIVAGRTFELDPSWLTLGNRSIVGVMYYEPRHLREAVHIIERTREKYPWAQVVSHQIPLAEIDHAFELADAGVGNRVAIVP